MPQLVVAERRGGYGGNLDSEDPEKDTEHVAQHFLIDRIFPRTHTLETDTESIPWTVTERVSVGARWFVGLILGFALLCAGESVRVLAAPDVWPLTIEALGIFVLVACGRAAVAVGTHSCLQDPTDRVHAVGPLSLIGIPGVAAVAVNGAVGLAAACVGLGGAFLVTVSSRVRSRLVVAPDIHTQVALVPSLHAIVTLGTSVTLVAFLLLVSRIEAAIGSLVVAVATGLGIAVVALGSITDRRAARVHTVIAAIATGFFPLLALLADPPTVTSRLQLAPLNSIALGMIGVAVAASWLVIWLGVADAGRVIGEWFDREGRRIGTVRAALFAYLVIVSSGVLLVATTGVVLALGWMVLTGRLPFQWPWLLTGFLFGTPLWILLGGVGYQLTGLVRSTVRFRRCPSATDLLPELPITPKYPVHVLDVDGFFAAAYADPFERRVILSRGAIEILSPVALAAVIAHEESHIEHRGAWLQVLLATLPLGGILGQNVVYSIYDFMERERTADDIAIDRLNSVGEDGGAALLDALDTAEGMPTPDLAWLTFLPTATTVQREEQAKTGLARLYYPLFGTFAGQVHPSPPSRRERIRGRMHNDR